MGKKIAVAKLIEWDKEYFVDISDFDVKINDYIIVNLKVGKDLAKVINIMEGEKALGENSEVFIFEKLASKEDIGKLTQENLSKKINSVNYCKGIVKNLKLPMKVVDAYFSFDEKRITFAFIANGRIDFRELVKMLTNYYQKSIRLHQIGVRDEAKLNSDVGSCGLKTCCKGFLGVLGNVNSDLAEYQQVSHRGSERLSGICGRLHCCLNYEHELYKKLSENLPPIGSEVTLKGGEKAHVKGWHTLKQTFDVQISGSDAIVEVDLKSIKRK